MKMMGVKQQRTLQTLFDKTIVRKAQKVISDPTHVLHQEYLPSGRRFSLSVQAQPL